MIKVDKTNNGQALIIKPMKGKAKTCQFHET